MKKILLLTMAMFFFVSGSAFAQALQVCGEKDGMAWEMNKEADMKEYRVYHSDAQNISIGGVGVTNFIVLHDPTKAVPDPTDATKLTISETFPISFPEGDRYFGVTAVDTSGNESGLSNEVGCTYDKAPLTPTIILKFN